MRSVRPVERSRKCALLSAAAWLCAALACAWPLPAALQPPTATPSPAPTETPFPTSTPAVVRTNTPIGTGSLPPWPLLQRGDAGLYEIFALQRLLRHHGFVVYVDGRLGEQTLTAVKGAQAVLGIPADGKVDEETWVALVRDIELKEGDKGEAVVAAVYMLQSKFGYASRLGGGVISSFGPKEADALRDFQARFRLPADGIVDLHTWQALISIRPAGEPWLSNPP
jgi:peptidoglycan hydrolase-like protein with peptidoglycan-binding domain